jgi:hypothetical protein
MADGDGVLVVTVWRSEAPDAELVARVRSSRGDADPVTSHAHSASELHRLLDEWLGSIPGMIRTDP